MTSTGPWWAPDPTRPRLSDRQVNRHRTRTTLRATMAAAIVTLAGLWVINGAALPDSEQVAANLVGHRQSTDALIAYCGPAYQYTGTRLGQPLPTSAKGTQPRRAAYDTLVPFYGDYTPQTTAPSTRFYPATAKDVPTAETLVGHLHTGGTVAWYTRDADPTDVTTLQRLSLNPELDLIVVPWEPMQRGTLPANRKIGYAVLGASQTCQRTSGAAIADLRTTYTR